MDDRDLSRPDGQNPTDIGDSREGTQRVENLNLDGAKNTDSEDRGQLPPIEEPQSSAEYAEAVASSFSVKKQLFGTVEIEGVGLYYGFLLQTRNISTWVLTERDIYTKQSQDPIVAVLKLTVSGRTTGYGKTYLLTRLLDVFNSIVGKAAASGNINAGFYNVADYSNESTGDILRFKTYVGGHTYMSIQMSYEGFHLDLNGTTRAVPFKIPDLVPVEDEKSKAAVIAGLGVRTFSLLKQKMGHALDWYDRKTYKLVTSNAEFRQMMLEFLRDVQKASDTGTAVLAALDTETTGLNMFKLDPQNPYRDFIVAIPFGWQIDKAYVICTQMYYFGNVDEEEIYPLFTKLFRRNVDYSYQDIVLDYEGQHFEFSRKNLRLVGANVGFDIRAFLSHDCDVFFDEDVQVMHYNLATDYAQGRNSLKWMTHNYLGDETLELEDLFGPQHKDKFRYLTDPELAKVYGGADADYPRVLWKKFRRMTQDKLYALYKKYDMTAVYRTAHATWQGMPVDEKSVKRLGEGILKDLDTLKDFIYRYAYVANRGRLDYKSEALCELLGLDSRESVENTGENEKMYRYKFTPANHKQLLFGVLNYPVIKISEKTQEPALDKFVLKKLAERERENPVEFLTQDIVSANDPDTVLISKDKFNKSMYPLASVFLKYSEINKEYTAYYKPIMTNDLEGRMFYTFSLQRAATRRILSAGQTMKSSLKKLVIAPPKKLFLCYDASQIEYRHMASLAYIQTKFLMKQEYPNDWEQRLYDSGIARIVRMMGNEEADYHIETASMMTGLPQYKIDHKTRKMYKSIGFGIPYGLGDRSMCDALFGKVTPENMEETRRVLDDYKTRQFEIIRLLETARDSAFIPTEISDEFRKMLNIDKDTCVGIVNNFVGFYRLFILEHMTRARKGRVRRQAGNCLIQGGAAELFRRMIYNFYQGCVKAGIQDKVEWLMLVHDEVDSLVDADIDVCLLIKTIYESCTLRYPDHIPYYVGIGLGHNWYDGKDDAAELPVIMVERLVKAYDEGKFTIPCDGQQPEHLIKLKRHYMCDRVGEELQTIIPNIRPGFEWSDRAVDAVGEQFTNYTVRSYMTAFCTKEDKAKYGKDIPLKVQLERWLDARVQYGFGVDFLQEKIEDARDEILNLKLDDSPGGDLTLADDGALTMGDDVSLDDLSIDLLDNTSAEEMLLKDDGWTGEKDLFDYGIPEDEILSDDSGSGYRYYFDELGEKEEDLEVNAKPTSAFDVFISNHYVRRHVFSTSEGVYSVMLSNTSLDAQVNAVAQLIKREFEPGSDTVIIIGSNIRKVSNVACKSELLDKLDQTLCEAAKSEG